MYELLTLDTIIDEAQIYFLVFTRVTALLFASPLFTATAIPRTVKMSFALFTAVAVFPAVMAMGGYPVPDTGLGYVFALIGELLIGFLMGLILQIFFAAFQTAGQLFAMQMGFGASQAFDPMSQVSIPLIGQYLNLVGMFVFLEVGGMQKIFLTGVGSSFKALKAVDLFFMDTYISDMLVSSLSSLFKNSLMIALPMTATLFLISVTIGLLAKAAPQMNLLMVGFPIQIAMGLTIIFLALPFIMVKMSDIIGMGFEQVMEMLNHYYKMGLP